MSTARIDWWVMAALMCLALTGCGKVVRVIDLQGKPIAGAHVMAFYPSFFGPDSLTGVDGETTVETNWLLKEEALSVSAIGFQSCWMPFPTTWPQTVQLKAGHDQAIGTGALPSGNIQDPWGLPFPPRQESGPRPPLK